MTKRKESNADIVKLGGLIAMLAYKLTDDDPHVAVTAATAAVGFLLAALIKSSEAARPESLAVTLGMTFASIRDALRKYGIEGVEGASVAEVLAQYGEATPPA